MRAQTDVTGMDVLLGNLGAAAVAVQRPTQALERVYAQWLQANRKRFSGGGFPAWEKLAPVSARRKAAHGKSTEPLAGGPLEASLTRKGAPRAIGRVEGSTLTMGTGRPEANAVRGGRGTRGKPGYMPRRDPVQFTRDERRQAANTVGAEIMAVFASGTVRKVRPRGV